MEEPPKRNTENDSERGASASTSGGGGESLRSELSRLLYRPLPTSQSERLTNDELPLSALPWKIDCKMPETTDNSSGTKNSVHFPDVSYLDLRRLQNTSYADSQCIKAQAELAKHQSKPEKFWKQALQLVPDHLPSLVGYAKYLLDSGKLEASEDLLQQAVAIDPNDTAVRYLDADVARLRQMRSQKQTVLSKLPFAKHGPITTSNTNNNLTARESSAYQDALMERQLMESPKDTNDNNATDEDSESYQKPRKEHSKRKKHRRDRDRRRRKRKERRRHKRRKRHRRRRYDSSDESSRSSSEDDDASNNSKGSNKSMSNASASRQEHSPGKDSNEGSMRESDKEDRRRKRRKRRRRDYDDDDHKHKSRSKKDERKRYRKERKYSTDDSSTSSR